MFTLSYKIELGTTKDLLTLLVLYTLKQLQLHLLAFTKEAIVTINHVLYCIPCDIVFPINVLVKHQRQNLIFPDFLFIESLKSRTIHFVNSFTTSIFILEPHYTK